MGLSGILSNKQNRVCLIATPNNPAFAGQTVTTLTFDASVKEHHSRESPATEFPVENGQVVSDHVIMRPFQLELEAVISDTPIDQVAALLTAGAAAVTGLLAGGAGVSGVLGKFSPGLALAPALGSDDLGSDAAAPNRISNTKYQTILDLQEARLPLKVFTTLKLYNNMWIKSVGAPRTSSTGRQVVVDINFIQLLLVQAQSVNVATYLNAAVGASAKDNGTQQASPYVNNYLDFQKIGQSVSTAGQMPTSGG